MIAANLGIETHSASRGLLLGCVQHAHSHIPIGIFRKKEESRKSLVLFYFFEALIVGMGEEVRAGLAFWQDVIATEPHCIFEASVRIRHQYFVTVMSRVHHGHHVTVISLSSLDQITRTLLALR